MKTTYWLVLAAACAAFGLTAYLRWPAEKASPAEVAKAPKPVREVQLPPVPKPADAPPVQPELPSNVPAPGLFPGVEPEPVPVPTLPEPPPVTPISGTEPVVPPVPPAIPTPPAVPLVPPAVPVASDPVAPPQPLPLPAPNPVPAAPAPPSPLPLPLPSPAPVLQPPVPPAGSDAPPNAEGSPAAAGKFVVLNDDKLIEGSSVTVSGNTVVVRQGVLDRPFPKNQVQFVASSKDEVYKFMLAKVPAADAGARIKVAEWCMFAGMREQALAEAREVQKFQPSNARANELVKSLEKSLKQFPSADAPKMTTPAAPSFPTDLKEPPPPIPPALEDPEPDVTPESAKAFPTRVQPFLANQCVECHARPDHAGGFKLARVSANDAGLKATRANLRAAASQLDRANPAASPLLMKSLAAHGGQKRPAIDGRRAAPYASLEQWAVAAVGAPVVAPAPAAPEVVPPAPTLPLSPVVEAATPQAATPVVPAPVAPPAVPIIPPADVPPVPPSMPPVIPAIPPAVSAPLPAPPVMPVGGPFGAQPPPKPPVAGPSGDEFDPSEFNRLPPK